MRILIDSYVVTFSGLQCGWCKSVAIGRHMSPDEPAEVFQVVTSAGARRDKARRRAYERAIHAARKSQTIAVELAQASLGIPRDGAAMRAAVLVGKYFAVVALRRGAEYHVKPILRPE